MDDETVLVVLTIRIPFPIPKKNIFIDVFGCKVLVWRAVCPCDDRNSTFFHESIINSIVYVNECLQEHFLPFLKKAQRLYSSGSHYSKLARDWLRIKLNRW